MEKQAHHTPARRPRPIMVVWSFVSAFIGLSAVALINGHVLSDMDMTMVIGSFGATAVLLYEAPSSPLAQPLNLIVGHGISALVGVAVYRVIGVADWLAVSLAVAGAISAMQLTRSLHPPGGATALIAVIGGEGIHDLGFGYVLFPVLSGALVMFATAMITNNLPKGRKWPVFWF